MAARTNGAGGKDAHKAMEGGTKSTSCTTSVSASKKPVRDSKRRASHSQIERRRREKINDRLVTLRSIVPACAAEIEQRRRIRLQEEDEARRIASGELAIGSAQDSGGKRRRKRRRAAAAAAAAAKTGSTGDVSRPSADKDDELGLHKLEVLTHTIEYIYELEARLHEARTGVAISRRKVIDDDGDDNFISGAFKSEAEEHDRLDEGRQATEQWDKVYKAQVPRPRRGTLASTDESSSMIGASPAFRPIASLPAESPNLTGRSSSASSLVTSPVYGSLCSSMMSLSAESPLLRWGVASTAATTPQSFGSASSLTRIEKGAGGDAGRKEKLPSLHDLSMLPDPAMPLHPEEASRGQKRARRAEEDNGHRDAELLLALKTSPDALRPMTSAVREDVVETRQTSFRRDSASHLPTSSGQFKSNQSAPGGAFATTALQRQRISPSPVWRADSTRTMFSMPHSAPCYPERGGQMSLPSPPLLALDGSASRSRSDSSVRSMSLSQSPPAPREVSNGGQQ